MSMSVLDDVGRAALQVETRNIAPKTSWSLQKENQACQSAMLSQKPPETKTHTKLKAGNVSQVN